MKRGGAAEGVYRALLKLYPAEFRAAYGEQMLQTFRDCQRDANQRGGTVAFWLKALADIVWNGLAERMKQVTTRRWIFGALRGFGASIAYIVSWLALAFSLIIITYVMLIPWEESIAPAGTLAGAVNDFFESNFILLPVFAVTTCQIIALSRLSRRRAHSYSRIYTHFTAVNIVVTALGLGVTQLSSIVIGRLFPGSEAVVIEPGYGQVIDPAYGAARVYVGLAILGAILFYFARLAWRTRDTLPLRLKRFESGSTTA